MAISREEVSDIAKKSAVEVVNYSQFPIRKDCREKAYHVYEAHEYTHAASRAALKSDTEGAERYINLARSELEAAGLPRENLEVLGQDLVDAAKLVKEKDRRAVYPLGAVLDKTKELMFQAAIDCQCGEALLIEEKLGKEALTKILAE